jgi:hypothetical protein
MQGAAFCTYVTVSPEDYLLSFDPDDTMEDILSGGDLCQDGVSFTDVVRASEEDCITPVFKERAHAETFQA